MCDLSLIERDDHDKEADSNSRNDTPGIEVLQRLRASLQPAAEDEDDGADEDCQTTSKVISCWAGEHGPEEGAAREDGDYSSLFGARGFESRLEIWRCDDSGNHAEVVAIEDRAHGGEDRDQELGSVISDVSSMSSR